MPALHRLRPVKNKRRVHDKRAIRITSVGESRSDSNVLLLR